MESVKKFSVRRCKEFLEFDIQAHVKSAWIYETMAVIQKINYLKKKGLLTSY